MPDMGRIEGDNRMPEQEMVKVYELAKELGIDSISLPKHKSKKSHE